MARKFRVIAHAMHETELADAAKLIPNGVGTEAFVTGIVDETVIQKLRDKGLIVQTISAVGGDDRPIGRVPETPGTGAALTAQARRRSTAFTRRTFDVNDVLDLNQPQYYLIQIDGPLLEDYKKSLATIGVVLLESFNNGYYSARLTAKQYDGVKGLPFVADVKLYDGRQSVPTTTNGPSPAAPSPPANADQKRLLTFDVRLQPDGNVDTVKDWLKAKGVAIAGTSARKLRIYVLEDSAVLGELANLTDVQTLQEFVPPKLFNDRARTLLGIDHVANPLPFDGTDEIIAIADTGLDEQHPDFPPARVVTVIAKGRPGNASDPSGHGTHVAGSALGDGSASNGAFKGVAPGAKLVFQSLLDGYGQLGGLPLDLNELFDEAYSHGARIHNNSWGAETASTYTFESIEVDEFVHAHRDMLIVVAAGNEGQAANRINSAEGIVDWLSIGAPATAKNALTVGASRSDRTTGGYCQYQWGQAWGADFPDPPIAQEFVSGDPESMAAFSSRGPSDDRRIKPDVVAPGTDILSCRSRLAPIRNFWGSYSQNTNYAYDGGTSMATPLVSGCAALVREYYRTKRQWSPSAALLRATLVNGARKLSGADANASNQTNAVPEGNFDQGFGRVDLTSTIPNPVGTRLALVFIDNWQNPSAQLARTGDRKRYRLKVRAGFPLRICLAYTDFPARALQNNLNLFVQHPSNKKSLGNERLRFSLGLPDGDNNVEVVFIKEPADGIYLVQIAATNLLHAPQDFALVVTGDIDGDLAEI